MLFNLSKQPELRGIAETLRALGNIASKHKTRWFVVGATARDLVLRFGYGVQVTRLTEDVDIAIVLPTWDSFHRLTDDLIREEHFVHDPRVSHRFTRNGLAVDIVPFGPLANGFSILWPPNNDFEMTVLGFEEALRTADEVLLAGDIIVKVASPPGLLLMKLIAWEDRHLEKPHHDAYDIAQLIRIYSSPVLQERLFDDAAEYLARFEFDVELAGAALIGQRAGRMAHPDTAQRVTLILERETQREGVLLLATDMSAHAARGNLELLDAVRIGFSDGRREQS